MNTSGRKTSGNAFSPTSNQICADCSASDPTWASLNRGVLICEECCSVHRVLGRHISHIKSLRKESWPPSQLQMIIALYAKGANSFWEHALIHPGNSGKITKRKPSARDPVNPNKNDFIRAKYALQSFIHRPAKDELPCSVEDLSQQLHSTVRTNNVDISLRLLCSGADPNHWHSEKGNRPLHIAAKAGQASQVELLVIYGADPGVADISGKTPADHARSAGFTELADRLIECQYELTDRLSFFLCNRKPDHLSGQHFIIPELGDRSGEMSELGKVAKSKLQQLSNSNFETLARDIYDEVDRREIDMIFQAALSQTSTPDRYLAAHLPNNSKMSSVHNQARQKLARLNPREFAFLIADILMEIKRRQNVGEKRSNLSTPENSKNTSGHFLEDRRDKAIGEVDREPVYDIVAIDDDYVDAKNYPMSQPNRRSPNILESGERKITTSSLPESVQPNCSPVNKPRAETNSALSLDQYLEMRRALEEALEREKNLSDIVITMKNDLSHLHQQVDILMKKNQSGDKPEPLPRSNHSSNAVKSPSGSKEIAFGNSDSPSEGFVRSKRDDSGIPDDPGSGSGGSPSDQAPSSNGDTAFSRCLLTELPSATLLNNKTATITTAIHDLKKAAESDVVDENLFRITTQRIQDAVRDLSDIFLSNQNSLPDALVAALEQLSSSAEKLYSDCEELVNSKESSPIDDKEVPSSPLARTDPSPQAIIDDAFNIVASLKRVLIIHSQLLPKTGDR